MTSSSSSREEYTSDESIAIIRHWRNSPTHPEPWNLIRLANIYEDEDDPASMLTYEEMAQLVSIFKDAAKWYVQQGIHDTDTFLEVEARHLRQRMHHSSPSTN